MEPFLRLGLGEKLLQALGEEGYEQPTPVQELVIPFLLQGRDVIAQARTGTGKTAAFALPSLERLETNHKGVRVLVLCPTRELALQVGKSYESYGRHLACDVLTIYGGASYTYQMQRLKKGVQVVVGTPGRLLDLHRRQCLKLDQVRMLVLDEADEMLSLGFQEQLEEIVTLVPPTRQTALFSATLPEGIQALASQATQNPERIDLSPELSARSVDLYAYFVAERDKSAAVTRILEMEDVQTCLIFCRTRSQTSVLAHELTRHGHPSEALHGAMDQQSREKILKRFREQTFAILVATDVAARGLDIDHLSHVINTDLPQNPDTFVHRIGRTGRAGRSGTALTLVTAREDWKLQRLERALKRSIEVRRVPTRQQITQARLDKLYSKLEKWLGSHRCKKELAWVDSLCQAGHKPRDIAAAALKLASASEKQAPIAEMSESESGPSHKPRPSGKKDRRRGLVQLVADIGNKHGLKPKELVAVLTRQANVPGRLIGPIRITKSRSFVDLPSDLVAQVLASNGRYQIGKRRFLFKVD